MLPQVPRPVNAWSTWWEDDVQISGNTRTSDQGGMSKRISCAECGGCVGNALPAFDMTAVFPMKLADPGFKFEPEWHLFHADRIVDFNDGLPKFSVTKRLS